MYVTSVNRKAKSPENIIFVKFSFMCRILRLYWLSKSVFQGRKYKSLCFIEFTLLFQENGSSSDNLMAVEVVTLSNDQCRKSYRALTERMFCAGVPEGGKDSCQVTEFLKITTSHFKIFV